MRLIKQPRKCLNEKNFLFFPFIRLVLAQMKFKHGKNYIQKIRENNVKTKKKKQKMNKNDLLESYEFCKRQEKI